MSSLNNAILEKYSVTLVPINEQYKALLLHWRNQDEIRKEMLNQALISVETHQQWFDSLAEKCDQQHFIILYKEKAIGAINLKCHQGLPLSKSTHAEVGLYIAENMYRGNIIAFAPSLVINDYAFQTLNIKQLSSKVRADNIAALKYNQQLGYRLVIDNTEFTSITLNQDDYHKSTQQLKEFLSRGNRRDDRTA